MPKIESVSRILLDQTEFARVAGAAVKVAGKDQYAAVRLRKSDDDTHLIVSAVNPKATFVAAMRADFLEWQIERDEIVEISKDAARSLAGYKVIMPKAAEMEQTVSLTIGEGHIRIQDETGLWKTPGGRIENRHGDISLGGDHERSIRRAEDMVPTSMWASPDQTTLLSSVMKALTRPLTVFYRSEPVPNVSRWLAQGPKWALTISTETDEEADDETPIVRVTKADPTGGIA